MKITIDAHPEGVRRYQHLRPAGRREDRCGASCIDTRWFCTLARGHRGPHVAHSRLRRVQAVWDGPPASREVAPRPSKPKAPTGLPVRTPRSALDLLKDVSWRLLSSAEEIALIVFFLAFVWFALDWLRLIFSG